MRLFRKLIHKKAAQDWRNTYQALHDEGSKTCSGRSQRKEDAASIPVK